MRMGEEDHPDGQAMASGGFQQLIDLVARVDDDPFAGVLAADDKPVLEKRGRSPVLQDHRD
jgi:hypothetical protein